MSGWGLRGLVVITSLSACTVAQPEAMPTTSSTEVISAPPPTTEAPVSTSILELVAPTSGAENCDESSGVDEVFFCWERNRQRVVDRLTAGIEAGTWGIGPNGVLRGPGGLAVDLSECPDGWSDNAGVDDETIRLAQTAPLSGGLGETSYSPGVEAYLDFVNENGGIGGRRLELSVHDDGYVPAATVEIVEQLLAEDEVLAVHTTGVSNTLAVAPLLHEACVPSPFAQASHLAFTDSELLWLTGGQLSSAAEVELWLTWLEQEHADRLPVSVAAIVMEGFGSFYETAFREVVERRPGIVSDFSAVWHDPPAPDIRPLLAEVAGFDPDVYIQMTAGHPCLMALEGALEHGLVGNVERPDRIFLTASVCMQPNAFLIPAGDAGNGALAIEGNDFRFRTASLPDHGPLTDWVRSELGARGLDGSQSLPLFGFIDVGWSLVEALRIADALPGGVSRSNLLLTMHSLDLDHPMLPPGVAYRTEGAADRHLIEGGPMMEYDAETQQWMPIGVVDVDGQTPLCTWVAGPSSDPIHRHSETYFGHCVEGS